MLFSQLLANLPLINNLQVIEKLDFEESKIKISETATDQFKSKKQAFVNLSPLKKKQASPLENFTFEKTIRKTIKKPFFNPILKRNNETQFNLTHSKSEKFNPNYIQELNNQKIFVLTTYDSKNNSYGLLQILGHQLFSQKGMNEIRKMRVAMLSNQDKYFNQCSKFIRRRPIYLEYIAAREDGPVMNKYFMNPSLYHNINKKSMRSICPIFFNQRDAEFFLYNQTKGAESTLKYLKRKSKADFYNSFVNTKIVKMGLGDFIQRYSTLSDKIHQQTEFIFIPSLTSLNEPIYSPKKFLSNGIQNTSFKSLTYEFLEDEKYSNTEFSKLEKLLNKKQFIKNLLSN